MPSLAMMRRVRCADADQQTQAVFAQFARGDRTAGGGLATKGGVENEFMQLVSRSMWRSYHLPASGSVGLNAVAMRR